MFKKITVLYLSMLFIVLFALMLLLITTTLIRIAKVKNKNIVNTSSFTLNSKEQNKLKISVDKNVYLAREKVLITFENLSNSKITQNSKSSLTVKCRRDIGNNYDIAFIEHKKGNDWIAIEPVNRCSDNCKESCSSNREIASKRKTNFIWSQTVLNCKDSNNVTISSAPFGAYRVSSSTWDERTSSFIRIYSDIFKISNISKK